MKTLRNFTISVGLFLMFVALVAVGARAQSLATTHFSGTLTLPYEVQWENMTLPAGDYTLYYGELNGGGSYFVEVVGKAKGRLHGFILIQAHDPISETENALVCVRQGNSGFVRELQMGAIGETVSFPLPQGVELLADQGSHSRNTQLAQASAPTERVSVALNVR